MSIKKDSLPSFIFDFAVIKDNLYYCREINKDQTQQIRYLRFNGKKEIPNTFKILNQAFVEKGEDFNLLSTITKESPKGDRIVEAPIYLHQINIYSSDGKWGKTICVGKADDIGDLEDKISWTRIYTHGGVCTYDKFFGVLFVNEDIRTMNNQGIIKKRLFEMSKLEANKSSMIIDWRKLSLYKSTLYFMYPYGDTIYSIDNKDSIKRLYSIDFGDKRIPADLFDENEDELTLEKRASKLKDYMRWMATTFYGHWIPNI